LGGSSSKKGKGNFLLNVLGVGLGDHLGGERPPGKEVLVQKSVKGQRKGLSARARGGRWADDLFGGGVWGGKKRGSDWLR